MWFLHFFSYFCTNFDLASNFTKIASKHLAKKIKYGIIWLNDHWKSIGFIQSNAPTIGPPIHLLCPKFWSVVNQFRICSKFSSSSKFLKVFSFSNSFSSFQFAPHSNIFVLSSPIFEQHVLNFLKTVKIFRWSRRIGY